MRFAIVKKNSGYVVRIFQAANEKSAMAVFENFLKDGVKDDCHENFFLKTVVPKRVRNNE